MILMTTYPALGFKAKRHQVYILRAHSGQSFLVPYAFKWGSNSVLLTESGDPIEAHPEPVPRHRKASHVASYPSGNTHDQLGSSRPMIRFITYILIQTQPFNQAPVSCPHLYLSHTSSTLIPNNPAAFSAV